MIYGLVFLGAVIGGVLRHLVNAGAARLFGYGFPFGTLTANVIGSVMMGLLGEFTTFSTFSLDAVSLWERGSWGMAVGYISISLFVSLAGLALGLLLIRLNAQGS